MIYLMDEEQGEGFPKGNANTRMIFVIRNEKSGTCTDSSEWILEQLKQKDIITSKSIIVVHKGHMSALGELPIPETQTCSSVLLELPFPEVNLSQSEFFTLRHSD